VIEAGVDLDFPLVLRALGPLDRIIQAAGRCNREGKLATGQVIVFNPAEGKMPPGAYKTATDITVALLGSGALDPDDPDAVGRYFQRLYATHNLDRDRIQKLRKEWDFPAIAEQMRLIDDATEDVIITSYGDSQVRDTLEETIDQLRRNKGSARMALRRLQPYLVAIRVSTAKQYRAQGLIEELLPGVGIWHGQYHPVTGLLADDDRSQLIF
jgi:CRISPR-associated endonuclease/helicase Cas3